MSYSLTIITSLTLCFLAQYIALHSSGGRFTKNESNFFSSIGRIQAGACGEIKVAFLGSSLTGRMPDRSHGYDGVANMGCDGGSAIDALRAMDRGILPTAPVLVVEVNTMIRAVNPNPSQVALAIERPWFLVGMKVPLLSAYARPSGFFYSKLLAKKIGGFDTGCAPDLRVRSLPSPVAMPLEATWGKAEQALIDEIGGITQRLKSRGTETLFVWLPPARADGIPPQDWILALPAHSGCKWWDIGQAADPDLVQITDGAHMAGPSAARTVRTVLDGLSQAGIR